MPCKPYTSYTYMQHTAHTKKMHTHHIHASPALTHCIYIPLTYTSYTHHTCHTNQIYNRMPFHIYTSKLCLYNVHIFTHTSHLCTRNTLCQLHMGVYHTDITHRCHVVSLLGGCPMEPCISATKTTKLYFF